MFLKPFKSKNKTSIKGSDRKKLRQDLGLQFKHLSEDELKALVPNKEEMSTMKLVTHSAHNMTVYSLGKIPVFYELDQDVFPTVYTLWRFPDMLPVFTTWPPVFSKLSAGADLMLPGVISAGPVGPNTFSHIRKGQVCAVKLLGNRAPVAVGRAMLHGSEMYECAMRGKGVHIMHTNRDFLWALGDKQDPPFIDDSDWVRAVNTRESSVEEEEEAVANGNITAAAVQSDNDDVIKPHVEGGDQCQVEGGVAASRESPRGVGVEDGGVGLVERLGELSVKEATDCEGAEGGEGEGDNEVGEGGKEDQISEDQEPGLSTQELTDNLLLHCFLCALKSSVNRKSDLPLLTSAFYRNHMLKFCPHDQTMDVKKSSYKKLGKFLHTMQQRGYIKVKELSKGSDCITEVNREHAELRAFVVPELPAKEESPSVEGEFSPPEITEMYTVTAAALTLFREVTSHTNKGDALTVPEIREILQMYVKMNNLQQGSGVLIDPVISSLVLHKGEYLETLRWDNFFTRVFSKLSPACRFVLPGQQPVLKKGKLEPITMKLATRAGNKKVTLIYHLEPYGIDLEQFSHTVQLAVACSTSISQLPGKGAGSEVLVQGNQINYVYQLLTEKYKVPKKYIQGIELAPKSGKKKR